MDPNACKNFPVFYIKNKESVNIDNDNLSLSIKRFEEYINSCFSCLPYNELKADNDKKFLIENFCDFFVFYNCDTIICSIIEKNCMIKTVDFFKKLEIKINNNEFKNGEDFLNFFTYIWDNFTSVIIHIADVLKSFSSYNKITCSNFYSPSYIFNELWRKYTNEFVNIKNYIISSVCEYLKWDKTYCEQNFYKYLCMNIYSNSSNNNENVYNIINNSHVNNRQNYDNLLKNEEDKMRTNDSNYIEQKEEDELSNNDNFYSNHIKKENNTSNTINSKNNDEMYNVKNEKVLKINDKLLSVSLKIIDILGFYEEFEKVYTNETYIYYKEKMNYNCEHKLKTVDGKDDDNYGLPIEIENYLCHEQMRSRKFLKEETEISILKMLKNLLIVEHKDILYRESYIKYCIIYEKYDPLRILYLFSINLNTTDEFCNLFFNSVETLGTELINNLINRRNNINLLNESIIELINFKLNVDRIIIMSFRYSTVFMKKWKEVFEHFLNKGMYAENYIPIILSIYLNNLLMMYNACLKKLRKYYLLNKKLKNEKNIKDDIIFEKQWNSYCNDEVTDNGDHYTVTTDSDNLFIIKKYLKKRKKKRNTFDLNINNNNNPDEVDQYLFKIEKLFKKYHEIGKNIMNIITIILSLFRYISDKEKFEKYYRIFMCKRLINDSNFNIILDIKVFKTLKKECGAQFTKKIEIILKDMKFTSKAMLKFYQELPDNAIQLLKKKKYSVNIIFNESWEYDNVENNVIYPHMIKLCNDFFFEFYRKCNKAKNIQFLPSLGLCTLKVNFGKIKKKYMNMQDENINDFDKNDSLYDKNFVESNLKYNNTTNYKKKKKFQFTVTVLQAIILLLFNEKYEYNINEIKNLTGISIENIIRYLKPLYIMEETNILIYDDITQTFKINFSFRSNKRYLIVNYSDIIYKDHSVIPALTQEDSELEDKSLHIDAAIVKFLKTNGKSSERKICAFVKEKMNISSNEQIKNRITSLLNREFIFFKNNAYHYEI
ncbi:cullin-like protein, putative [Plasmodium gallinaceum]|uniref:Cullin-like protein, putative n=1 Tax=Plasmodium gallinaceum TaxID=5849 RepID=A0A1J1GS54_PLAGA|nr:cullin-like protein, putative [Plasmodium gallinaceum]CRG93875.1 cullin-like protein, putative [Plasmodium gallinaceum]